MYHLAVLAILGLALLRLADLVADFIPERVRAAVVTALAVAGAFALDYSVLDAFGARVRSEEIGILATGLALAGVMMLWRVVLGRLTAGGAGTGGRPGTAGGPRSVAA